MDTLRFKVSAELKNILGKDLITSPNVAVLELVKNSYDAHATKVEISFSEDCVVISDNGKGMTLDDIINKWLFIAYSAKSDGTEDSSYRNNIKRYYAGAKGIGRLSCDRLSRYLTMTTKSKNSQFAERIVVDWKSFENKQSVELGNISVVHETLENAYSFPLNSKNGTELKLECLNEIWDDNAIISLRKSLEKLINPFLDTDEFSIEIKAEKYIEQDKLNKSKGIYSKIVNGLVENSISQVLKEKTTMIESKISNNKIKTSLIDRDVVMYSIEEPNKFESLTDSSISLYFLNRSAKYSFSQRMGMSVSSYGSIFLFRNGFRILPYGEPNDDSWDLNHRMQQGFKRYLGTRDLLGRVDVITDNPNEFKEVSSRDGGLIKNDENQQIFDYFTMIHRRLERYVSGVLWGVGFLKNEYFINKEIAKEERSKIKEDKDNDNVSTILGNVGSRVDFFQLIKTLVNDKNIDVKYYNTDLIAIVTDKSDLDVINDTVLNDFSKIISMSNNSEMAKRIEDFTYKITQLQKDKEEAEKKALLAIEEAKVAEQKRANEEKLRKEREKELEAQIQKNVYLSATRNTTQEVQDITHAISIASTELISLLGNLNNNLSNENYSVSNIELKLHEASFFANKVKQLSMLITKADIVSLKTKVRVDVKEYIKEYVSNFKDTLQIEIKESDNIPSYRMLSLLDIAIVFDNLISNSKKACAKRIGLSFSNLDEGLSVIFSDDGEGVDLEVFTPDTLFIEGSTNKRGGSGIGLHTIKYTLENRLNGNINFLGNGVNGFKGASFCLIFRKNTSKK